MSRIKIRKDIPNLYKGIREKNLSHERRFVFEKALA